MLLCAGKARLIKAGPEYVYIQYEADRVTEVQFVEPDSDYFREIFGILNGQLTIIDTNEEVVVAEIDEIGRSKFVTEHIQEAYQKLTDYLPGGTKYKAAASRFHGM